MKTPMLTFGKYRGESAGDVPASYLLWALEEGVTAKHPELHEYISANKRFLEAEVNEGRFSKEGCK